MNLQIEGILFQILEIDKDKLLFQAQSETIKDYKVVQIGEYIQLSLSHLVENVVASESEILVYFHAKQKQTLVEHLSNLPKLEISQSDHSFDVEVCFDLGLDWETVERISGMNKDSIVQIILNNSFSLINYGFQPGFMYLNGLPEELHLERRSTPRQKVPKGSLAIGGKYIGIYGSESPGGWHVIGRTSHFPDEYGNFEKLASINQNVQFISLDKESYLRKYGNE